MPEPTIAAAKTDHIKGKDINGQVVTLERTQPRQLSLFQTFLSDEERYSNTIELYDAVPKYFSNHKTMASMRKSGQYLPILKRESLNLSQFVEDQNGPRTEQIRPSWP